MGRGLRNVTRLASACTLAAAFILSLPLAASAQGKWPERPVKLVLPFGPGGVADVTARIMAEKLGDKLGQRFIVENMPSAGGINAARAIATATPDGYTMGLVTNGTAISVATFKSLPFDPVKDFALISTIGQFDLAFAVNTDSEFKTLGDFIKAAKANPGKLNIGTIIAGSTQNLGAELFKMMGDLNVAIIPFKNSPDLVVAMLRNDVQLVVDFPPAIQGQVNDKKLRVLAMSSPKRSPLNPDIPTVEEAGVKGYEVTSWNGVGAPKGTPQEIVETMNKAMREVLAMPDVKAQFAQVGVLASASSPDELMTRLVADIKKWNDVVDKAGIARK